MHISCFSLSKDKYMIHRTTLMYTARQITVIYSKRASKLLKWEQSWLPKLEGNCSYPPWRTSGWAQWFCTVWINLIFYDLPFLSLLNEKIIAISPGRHRDVTIWYHRDVTLWCHRDVTLWYHRDVTLWYQNLISTGYLCDVTNWCHSDITNLSNSGISCDISVTSLWHQIVDWEAF